MTHPQSNIDPYLDAQNKLRAGAFGEAVAICERLLARDPNDTNALNILAIAYAYSGQGMKSVEALARAVVCEPSNTKLKTNFAKAVDGLAGQSATTDQADMIKRAIQVCLEDDQISHKAFSYLWSLLVMQDQVLILDGADLHALKKLLSDPFLHLGLRRLIGAGGIPFERMMTDLRRSFLMSEDYDAAAFLPFLCALAEQCHLNEYVYAVTDEERERFQEFDEQFATSVDFSNVDDMAKVALVGCYQDIDQADWILDGVVSGHEAFDAMLQVLVKDPRQVRALQGNIPAVSSINDGVSSAVRAQYEGNPYPRWRSITAPALSEEDRAKGSGKRILIAGCGTGQEILNMALHYPEAEMITGADLSLASLAYGKQKAVELGIENVEFLQGDILEIGQLDRRFDMITCSGVLHHMKDPVAGWQALLTCLKPDGVMKIALYSRTARRFVIQCQDWIKDQGYAPTAEGISAFRQDVIAMDDVHPIKQVTQAVDFYAMSMCRDLVFHVQEHVYDLPQIAAILKDLDLAFLGMEIQQPQVQQAFAAQFSADPQGLSFENWHAFEQSNPDVFAGMYAFWVARKGDEMPDWVFTWSA